MLEKLKPRHSLQEFVDYAWKTPMAEFNDVYGLNCTAVYYTILAFLDLLDEGNKKGNFAKSQVIATASTASFLRNPRAGFAYCSSKAGLISMMKCFSTFMVPFGIRFNAIAAGCMLSPSHQLWACFFLSLTPGAFTDETTLVFPSEMSAPLFAPFKISKEKAIDEEGAFARSYQPAERAGKQEDMAGTTLYLASRAGSFVNGSVMLVDGGKIATMPATY